MNSASADSPCCPVTGCGKGPASMERPESGPTQDATCGSASSEPAPGSALSLHLSLPSQSESFRPIQKGDWRRFPTSSFSCSPKKSQCLLSEQNNSLYQYVFVCHCPWILNLMNDLDSVFKIGRAHV